MKKTENLKVVDPDDIYDYIVLSFFPFEFVKMLNENNSTFSFEGILNFFPPQFDLNPTEVAERAHPVVYRCA
jgi:hypothetical protein